MGNVKKLSLEGFTILELLIVMAIIGILATVLVVAVNPGRQLAKARDTQRETDLVAILSVIYQYSSEHSGGLPDTDGNPATSNFPTTMTCIGSDPLCFDLAAAGDDGDTIVPVYIIELPKDPRLVSTGHPATDANTGYEIMVDANGHLIASASGETKSITAKR
jgi:prepilin-type N-terminal cleavage/methylation domain-containing protein